MVTSPTSEKISRKEAKVSGSCQFSTRLPPEEGKYGFLVSVSPGGQTFMTEDKQFIVGNYVSLCSSSLINFPFEYKERQVL